MHLVTGNIAAGDEIVTMHFRQGLAPTEACRHIQKTEAVATAGWTFTALRVVETPAQHLIAAAQAQHRAAPAQMRLEIDIPTGGDEGLEIADRRFRTRQEDEIEIAGQGFARR